MKGISVKG